jgi:hypothetical protein
MSEVDAEPVSLETVVAGDRKKTNVITKAIAAARHRSTNVRNFDERGSRESLVGLRAWERDTN